MQAKFIAIVAFAAIAAVVAVVVRQYLPSFGTLISLGALVSISLMIIPSVDELVKELTDIDAVGEYFEIGILIKCVVMTVLGRSAGAVCTDCGQAALAAKVSLVTRLFILLSALPVFKAILEIVKVLIGG